jgi:hypothetical protein
VGLGEAGNAWFVIAFIGLWFTMMNSGERGFRLPPDRESWFYSIFISAFFALCIGLLAALLTDSLPHSPSTGREPAPDTISDIFRDRR